MSSSDLNAEILFDSGERNSLSNPVRLSTSTMLSPGNRESVRFWQILTPRAAECERFRVRIVTTNGDELALLEIEPKRAVRRTVSGRIAKEANRTSSVAGPGR